MQVTIQSTEKITHINGLPCRIWEGRTENGTYVHCYIHRVAINNDEPEEVVNQFQKSLLECIAPSQAVQNVPIYLLV